MSDGNGQSSPTTNNGNTGAKTAAGWGGLGGGVIGGIVGLFASAANDGGPLTAGFLTVVGGAIVGVITAACAFLVAYLNNATKLQKDIGELRQQVHKLENDLHTSLLREKDLKYDLERAQKRIEVLENTAGISHAQVLPGVVIADFNGIIQEYSPSLTATLGWLPEQMRGESIERLIPSDLLEAHRTKFKAAMDHGGVIDSSKRLNTYALDKNGNRVPVTISLRKWGGEFPFITATVVIRPSASAGTLDHHTPRRRSSDIG